jgi:predicted alpha/beta hydrolase family esterase
MSDRPTLIVVPGWNNSGPGHWQSILAQKWPGAIRIEQEDWVEPSKDKWVSKLAHTILEQSGSVLIAAHSLGCTATVNLPQRAVDRIHGALLVAPANPLRRPVLERFAPVPLDRLPYQSTVVASDDDPYCPLDLAQHYAKSWGSEFICIPNAGHLNIESGYGNWPRAEALLNKLMMDFKERVLRAQSIACELG